MKAQITNPARDRLWCELRNKQIEQMMRKVRQINLSTQNEQPKKKLDRRCKICEYPSNFKHLFNKKNNQIKQENQLLLSSGPKNNIFDSLRCFEKFCDQHESKLLDSATFFFRKFPGTIQQFFSRSIIWDQMPLVPILRCIQIILELCQVTDFICRFHNCENKEELENPLLQNGLTHEILTNGLIPMLQQKIGDNQEFMQIKETLNEIRCLLVKQFPCSLATLYSKEDFYLILCKAAPKHETVDNSLSFWLSILEKISNTQELQLMHLIIDNEIIQKRNKEVSEQIFTKAFKILLLFLDFLSYLQFGSYLKKIGNYFNEYVQDKPLRNVYNENQLIRQFLKIYGKCYRLLNIRVSYDEINREIMIQEVSHEMEIEQPDFESDYDQIFIQ